ncbi:entry exclusion lipoprotein TrbK [Bartonella sp. DGB2]|uniref:entry exclusion lipoprotein TrbK n=1 Tax=Bartonella sp. DGB2 TaxID=3388426 RepID=UPI00398FBADA
MNIIKGTLIVASFACLLTACCEPPLPEVNEENCRNIKLIEKMPSKQVKKWKTMCEDYMSNKFLGAGKTYDFGFKIEP